MSRPLPWSYSSLNKFTTCPNQFYETKVLKNFADEPGEAALWGTYIHKCIEDAVNLSAPMPDNAKEYGPHVWAAIDGLRGARAEVKLAIDTKLNPCDWENRWCGSISDILKIRDDTAWVIDWKLGKVKPSAQLKLNALMVLYNYPEINTVHTSFEWLNKSVPNWIPNTRATYTRDQIPELWNSFTKDLTQYVQAFKTDTWQCRPSGLCKNYCPVTSCQHCGGYARNLKAV